MIALINPPLVLSKGDPHTGIVYMPYILAYLSANLKAQGFEVEVIDAFGEAPHQTTRMADGMLARGLTPKEIMSRITPSCRFVFVYFLGTVSFRSIVQTIGLIKAERPDTTNILVENAQSVTAFSLKEKHAEFLGLGFDALLYGDPELTAVALVNGYLSGNMPRIDGVIYRFEESVFCAERPAINDNLDALPLPDWKSFPLRRYWGIGYAHGPFQGPYLNILGSRGCTFRCRFCVMPRTSSGKWRIRSAGNIVDEMAFFQKELGVSDFHFQDVNPTISDKRIVEICTEIISRGLRVSFGFMAGTKIETLRPDTLDLLAEAGCRYISFSPESGSPALLKKMNKPFNHRLALEMVERMAGLGIFCQACFILGFPGEEDADIRESESYVRRLVMAGLDEIALFIVTPMPGSDIQDLLTGYGDYSQLTFSPRWRPDYSSLAKRRAILYGKFLVWKARYSPGKTFRQFVNIFRGRFDTKMEQALYRSSLLEIRNLFRGRGQSRTG